METNRENTVTKQQSSDQPAFSEQIFACIKGSLSEVQSKIQSMEQELRELYCLEVDLKAIVEKRELDKD